MFFRLGEQIVRDVDIVAVIGLQQRELDRLVRIFCKEIGKEQTVSERFAQLPVSSAPDSTAAIRIRRGDTVVEVSSDAPERLLSFLKEVMFRAV